MFVSTMDIRGQKYMGWNKNGFGNHRSLLTSMTSSSRTTGTSGVNRYRKFSCNPTNSQHLSSKTFAIILFSKLIQAQSIWLTLPGFISFPPFKWMMNFPPFECLYPVFLSTFRNFNIITPHLLCPLFLIYM